MAVERSMQVRLDMLVGDYIRNADRASKATMGIGKAAEAPRSALERVQKAGRDVGKTLVSASSVGVAAIAAWGTSAFAAGAAFNTLQQTAGAALVTVLGSAEAASAQMEELVGWSKTSPFPRQLWIEAQQMLLGFGMEAERIVPTLAAIQDGVVAVGGSAQSIREVVQILAQVQSTGKITAETLNQLALRGIDAATLIGDSMGRTAAQIRDDVSSSAIDAQTFLVTLTDSLQDRFQGAAEGLRTTWVGAFDRIKGATRDIGSILAEPFIDPAGGGAAVVWANDVADALRALEAAMRPAMEVLRDRAEPAVQAASDAMQRLAAAIREVDLVALIDRLSGAGPVLAAFGAAAAAAGSASVLSAIGMGSLAAAINPVGAGLITLAAVSPELRAALTDLVVALAPLIPPLTDLAVQLAGIATVAVGAAGGLLSALIPAVTGLVTVITPVVELLAYFTSGLDAIPGPVLAAAAGLTALIVAVRMLRTLEGSLAIAGALVGAVQGIERGANRAKTAVRGLWTAFGPLGIAVAVGVTAISALGAANAESKRRIEELTGTLDEQTGAITDNTRAWVAKELEQQGMLATARGLGIDLSLLVDAILGEADALDRVNRVLDSHKEKLVLTGQTVGGTGSEVESLTGDNAKLAAIIGELNGDLDEAVESHERVADASGSAAEGQEELADGIAGVREEAAAAVSALQELADELRAQSDPAFALTRAYWALEEAQTAYDEAVAEHGATSQEAQDAALKQTEAMQALELAELELAEATGGELTPAIRDMLEAAGVLPETIDEIESSMRTGADAADDFRASYVDMNADIMDSSNHARIANGLYVEAVAAGIETMSLSQANFVVRTKASVDQLIAAGWSYSDAIEFVAANSNASTDEIEQGFRDARDAGLEFSDDYPASVRLTGDDEVKRRINEVKSLIDSINRTVNIAFRYTSSGDPRAFMPQGGASIPFSRGGRVPGPMGAGDVVSAMLTPGEHVWTTDEVRAAGGHAGVEAMRAAVLATSTRFAAPAPVSMRSTVRAPSGGGGITIENFNLESVNERFDTRQVRNALMFEGAY